MIDTIEDKRLKVKRLSNNGSKLYQWVIGTVEREQPILNTFMNGCAVMAFAIAFVIALKQYYDNVEKGADAMEQLLSSLSRYLFIMRSNKAKTKVYL